jgi:hypothetical protein
VRRTVAEKNLQVLVDPRPVPFDLRSKEAMMAKYMLIMRGTDESFAKVMETPFEEMRLPAFPGSKCEIRRVPSIDEFPQENEWIIKERAWRERTGQL